MVDHRAHAIQQRGVASCLMGVMLNQIPIPRMIFINSPWTGESVGMGNSKNGITAKRSGCKIVREVSTMEIPVQYVCWREAVAGGSLSSARAGGFLRRVVHGFLAYR